MRSASGEADYLLWLSLRFREAEHLPAALREALSSACRSERPVRSVNQLAAAMASNRRTLWHQWRRAVGSSELRLQDFLHWILLLHALGRKSSERSWGDVAQQIGVHAHTLSRYARQLTGRTLSELDAGGEAAVTTLFRERVLQLLLREPGSSIS